jgi:hypothetical protein
MGCILIPGKMEDAFVHGGQDQLFLHGEAQEVGICYLFRTIEPLKEWVAQRLQSAVMGWYR